MGRTISYCYLADGTKVSTALSGGRGRRYRGNFLYETDPDGYEVLSSIAWDEGRLFSNLVAAEPVEEPVLLSAVPGPGGNPGDGGDVTDPADLALFDFGARSFDPFTARWTTSDPMASKYPGVAPYAYCGGDPVNRVDPDGLSTLVLQLNDGAFCVVGGNINDNDKSIYLAELNEKGEYVSTGTSVGHTVSLYSFYNTDSDESSGWQIGAIINPNDRSGIQFLSCINPTLSLDDYIPNAKNGKLYDFKVTNGEESGNHDDVYRGMPIISDGNGTIYASARDIGNIAAGRVAGYHGLPWFAARLGFDIYQSQSGHIEREGKTTRSAQYVGWKEGHETWKNMVKKVNLVRHK